MKKSIKTLALLSTMVLFSDASLALTYDNGTSATTSAYGSLHNLSRNVAPQGESVFAFSPRLRLWAFYNAQGQRIAYGRAGGGSDWCAELGRRCHTPSGTFRVQSKGDASCISHRFPLPHGGAPMPYCMHFSGGYAIHGSPYVSGLNSSHGCVRVTTPAARWLSQHHMHHGTKVVILPYS